MIHAITLDHDRLWSYFVHSGESQRLRLLIFFGAFVSLYIFFSCWCFLSFVHKPNQPNKSPISPTNPSIHEPIVHSSPTQRKGVNPPHPNPPQTNPIQPNNKPGGRNAAAYGGRLGEDEPPGIWKPCRLYALPCRLQQGGYSLGGNRQRAGYASRQRGRRVRAGTSKSERWGRGRGEGTHVLQAVVVDRGPCVLGRTKREGGGVYLCFECRSCYW